jgi:hypothetical protein
MRDEIRSKPLNNPSRVMEGDKEGSNKIGLSKIFALKLHYID